MFCLAPQRSPFEGGALMSRGVSRISVYSLGWQA